MKKWFIRTAVFIVLIILILCAMNAESLLAGIAESTLSAKYRISLDYEKAGMTLFSGGISFENLKINYNKPNPPVLLATAGGLDIGFNFWQTIKGNPEFKSINADRLQVEVKHNPDGSLPIVNAIQEFNSNNAVSPAKTVIAQITPASGDTAILPKIILRNSSFLYEPIDKTAKKQHVNFGYAFLNIDKDQINIQDALVYLEGQKNVPLLHIGKTTILSAILGKQLDIQGEDVQVIIHETGKDHYDLNDSLNAWVGAFLSIFPIDTPANPEKTDSKPQNTKNSLFNKGTLNRIWIKVIPKSGSPLGSLDLKADSLLLAENGRTIQLKNVILTEAGKEALKVNNLTFIITKEGDVQLEALDFTDAEITIRENAQKALNISRVVERIESVINALFFPVQNPESLRSAFNTIPDIKIKNSRFTWEKEDREGHTLSLAELEFSEETQISQLFDLAVIKGTTEPKLLLNLPSLRLAGINLRKNQIDDFSAEEMTLNDNIYKDGIDATKILTDWYSLPGRLYNDPASASVPSKNVDTFHLGKVSLSKSRIALTDTRLTKPLNILIDPLDMIWTKVQLGGENPPMGDISLLAATSLPTEGGFTINGKAGSLWSPVNADVTSTVSLKELTAITQFFEESLPIGIISSGVVLDGAFLVKNNFLDSTFDLVLKNPKFSSDQGKWPVKIDGKTAVAALNGMRNDNGEIIFKNNKLTGNLFDPKFDFRTGILRILSRNLINRAQDVVNLPLNLAGKGVNFVGNQANAVKKGVGGLLKSLTGKKKKP